MIMTGTVIGIDLGTTFSSVAYVDADGHVICLPNRDGQTLTPSAVYLDDDGRFHVGAAARDECLRRPEQVALAFKRRIGHPEDPWTVAGRSIDATTLSSLVLRRLREDAEHAVGSVAGAVITVPAYFGDRERTATLEAARLAGLKVLDILNEPTAAALAYAFDAYVQAGGDAGDLRTAAIAATAPAVCVVCDLGGGTFDVTVLKISGPRFDVLATGGALTLGGQDWDERIVDAIERHTLTHGGPDSRYDPRARARMRRDAEQAKHVLSVKGDVDVPAPYEGVPPMRLTRDAFENLTSPLSDRVLQIISGVLDDAQLTWNEIEDVLLVGGSTRMPHIRRRIARLSGKTPNTRLQPDLAVAQGAAVYAAILRVQGDTPPSSTAAAETRKADAAPANASAFTPAFEAAAADIRLSQVNSRSLGVIVRSPRYDKLVNAIVIPRNTRLPACNTRRFVTHGPNQRRIRIPIVEGETRDIRESVEVGVCVIDGLPDGLPAGAEVDVTFTYDASGRVSVRAEEKTTRRAAETFLDRAASHPPSELDELAEAVAQLSAR
ncbi:MAG: chaperone protein DnaK [Phycisphaerae bacterium]